LTGAHASRSSDSRDPPVQGGGGDEREWKEERPRRGPPNDDDYKDEGDEDKDKEKRDREKKNKKRQDDNRKEIELLLSGGGAALPAKGKGKYHDENEGEDSTAMPAKGKGRGTSRGRSSGPAGDKGSGVYWNNHLRKHGNEVETIAVWEFNNLDECSNFAIEFSKTHDIVKSTNWANLCVENGLDGGDKFTFMDPIKLADVNKRKSLAHT
jgi:hypothetical protein